MKNENIDLPDYVLEEIKSAWGKGENKPASTPEEAKKMFDERVSYGLKLYWLRSGTKQNPHNVKIFQWITENFVPAEIQQKYINESIEDIKFKNEHYTPLIQTTLDKLWNQYTQCSNNELPHEPVKKNIFKSIFKK